jgi:hypothetical protein
MRLLLLFLVCFFSIALPVRAETDEEKEKSKAQLAMEERSTYAAELFHKTCFMNFTDRDKLVALLDASYKRVDDYKRIEVLNFLQANGGDVWTAVITPKLTFTVIAETDGKCHVMVQRGTAEKLHKEIKNLAMDVRDSMSFAVVDYKGVAKDSLVQNSRFDVKAPDGSIIMIVSAATKTNPETIAAEGVLTVFAPPKE